MLTVAASIRSRTAGPMEILMSKVSVIVIVPSFKCEAYVESSLGSAASLSEPDLQIIAVDGGSTDRTLPLLREIASDDPRVEIARAPERASAVYA
jgi:teichuronic acid biosynthesis glycosyltransferase TuaG